MKLSHRAISLRTRVRDARRTDAELDALFLARELDKLSVQFPHFSPSINRWAYHVRFQLRSPKEKKRLIRRALARFDRLALEEIADETGLETSAVVESLAPMIKRKEIELCLRDGEKYQPRPNAPLDVLGRQITSRSTPVKAFYFQLRARNGDD